MSIESAIEEKIKQGIARGDFDNLAGAGKPLDLDAYFDTPEDMRMAFAMLKSNDFVPSEVEKFNEAAEIKERIKACSDEQELARLTKQLNELNLSITQMLETRRRKK